MVLRSWLWGGVSLMDTDQTFLSVSEIRSQFADAEGPELSRLLVVHGADARAGVVAACRSAQARERARDAEHDRTARMYELERTLYASGFLAVAGIDEVGRGALAGPVTAGAVILSADAPILRLNDSKKLSPARREELALAIHAHALAVGVGHVAATEIDACGLASALRTAMHAAIAQLAMFPDHVIVDGVPLGIHTSETAVVKGDAKVAAVAAASIVAKVARDALMREAAALYPGYGLDVNKGYGTAEHIAAVAELGPCPLHRRTFCGGGGNPTLF